MSLILSGTDGLSDVDGTAATPAIRGTDANTGIFFPAADTIAFSKGGAEAMRIDSGGSVRINNTSNATFSAQLNTQFASAFQCGQYLKVTDTSASQSMFIFGNSSSDAVGSIATSGSATSYNTSATSGIIGVDASTIAINTASSERMRIASNGDLLVGTTTTGAANTQGLFLNSASGATYASIGHVNGTGSGNGYILFLYNGANIGYISQNGTTAVAYNTSSDYRLKENIAPMTGALAKVAQLKPVTYKWKLDGSDGQGFIAHELQEVIPDCVTGEKDAVEAYTDEDGNETTRPVHQGVDTSFLVATLTAAIQEQQALITALTARITALEQA